MSTESPAGPRIFRFALAHVERGKRLHVRRIGNVEDPQETVWFAMYMVVFLIDHKSEIAVGHLMRHSHEGVRRFREGRVVFVGAEFMKRCDQACDERDLS